MRAAIIRVAVRAEMKRARRYARPIARRQLAEETGLSLAQVEAAIAAEARELIPELIRETAAEEDGGGGGAAFPDGPRRQLGERQGHDDNRASQ